MTTAAVALTADGPFNLVRLIATDEVFAPHARYLGSLIRQAPALAGIRIGITDTYVLAVMLGVGYVVIPAAVWSGALLFTSSDVRAFVAVGVTAGVTALATWFCSVSESVLAVALTGLVWSPLASAAVGMGVTVLASTASLILVASYETALATSTILGLWAIARARATEMQRERIGCAIVALTSAAAIVVSLSGSSSNQNSSNSRSFAYFVVSLDPAPVYVVLACGALVVAGFVVADRRLRAALLVSGLGGALLATASLDLTPSAAYAARGAAVIGVLALQVFLAILWRRSHRDEASGGARAPERRWALAVPVAFVALMCAANIRALDGWSQGLDAFGDEVDAATGLVFVDDALSPDRRQAVWGWTGTSLSLVVRRSPENGVLVDRDPSFVPFASEDAGAQIPATYTWRR